MADPVSGPVRVSRAPVLRDATGAVRGYLPYLSFDVPLLMRLLATRGGDVVVCEPPPTTGAVTRVACAVRRIPYVHYAGDLVSDAAAGQGTNPVVVAVVRALERFTLRGASRVIAVSDGVARRVEELSGRGAEVVPNGIDCDHPVDEGDPPPAGFPDAGGPVFLYAGTVAEWLGPEVFLDAWPEVRRRLPSARLVVLGQGSAWEALRRRARGMEGVDLVPAVSPTEARRWVFHADVALSSMRPGAYDYAYPTKVLAALAQGTPVVHVGPGPVVADIGSADLGAVCDFDPAAVARTMVEQAGRAPRDRAGDRARLREWVGTHRSLRVSSARAADIVLGVASAGR